MNGIAAPIVAAEPRRDRRRAAAPRRSVSVVMVVYMTGEALQQSVAVRAERPAGRRVRHRRQRLDRRATPNGLRGLAERDRPGACCWPATATSASPAAPTWAREPRQRRRAGVPQSRRLPAAGLHRRAGARDRGPARALHRRRPGAERRPHRAARRAARRHHADDRAAVAEPALAQQRPGLAALRGALGRRRRARRRWPRCRPSPAPASACAARTSTALSGFDEKYFLHVEDVDLCWRVRQAGGEVLFHPKAEVIHLGHTSRDQPAGGGVPQGRRPGPLFPQARRRRRRSSCVGLAALAGDRLHRARPPGDVAAQEPEAWAPLAAHGLGNAARPADRGGRRLAEDAGHPLAVVIRPSRS